jgi:hypothetical protein
MDFQFDDAPDGRRLKVQNVIDENSQLCLAIRLGSCCNTKEVVAVLEELFSLYPPPTFIRRNNGSADIAHTLWRWSRNSETATGHLEPGSLWQKGSVEAIDGPLRDEPLNAEPMATVTEAQSLANLWR